MNYLDPTNKLFIFIGWWVNYPPFVKYNLEKTINKTGKMLTCALKTQINNANIEIIY